MGMNNINTDAAGKFMEEARNDPQVAKKSKRVEGEGVEVKLTVASDVPRERLEQIEALARDRCPGVYCLINPIQLTTNLVTEDV
jgi:hypothetical protein